jgi:hypothetical protein
MVLKMIRWAGEAGPVEKGQKAAHQMKSIMEKGKNYLCKLRVTMQMGEKKMKVMTMMMGENQSSQSQGHVTAFRGTEG